MSVLLLLVLLDFRSFSPLPQFSEVPIAATGMQRYITWTSEELRLEGTEVDESLLNQLVIAKSSGVTDAFECGKVTPLSLILLIISPFFSNGKQSSDSGSKSWGQHTVDMKKKKSEFLTSFGKLAIAWLLKLKNNRRMVPAMVP